MSAPRGLSRRRFLGGAGALVTLPLLEEWTPRRAHAGAAPPQRMIFYFVPNGIHMPSWRPQAAGPGYEVPPILRPLAALRDQVLVLSGLANMPGKPLDGPGDHAAGTGAFLTCTRVRRSESDLQNGVSVDQLAAQRLGRQTRFPSMQLGAEGGKGDGACDSGYSCAYERSISWAGPRTPLPKSANPQVVFDLLFGGADVGLTAQEIERRRRRKKSVLDYVLADAKRLRGRLGPGDRHKLDEYLQGIRAVELSLDGMGQGCRPSARPDGEPPPQERVKVMTDLMVLMFQCDITRVISFMLGNAASERAYPFLGIPEAHHEISHHMKDPQRQAQLEKIDTWEVAQLAYLLERLQQVREGEGTLLDQTVVYFSSEISDGNTHNHDDLPVLLAGRLGGALRPGRHIVYPDRTPLANLFLSLLAAVGAPRATFGDDGTQPLEGLA